MNDDGKRLHTVAMVLGGVALGAATSMYWFGGRTTKRQVHHSPHHSPVDDGHYGGGSLLLKPRFENAMNHFPPGNWDFWRAAADQADLFSFTTAQSGKGGPFGAQLWAYHEPSNRYVMIGGLDSNAVVSKGIGSAHAEHENLSEMNRLKVIKYLSKQADKTGWHVLQVSSGESCQSCRAKQVLLAEELYHRELLPKGHFHVVFKACYERTRDDAGFNDLPYDMTYRLVKKLGVLEHSDFLFHIEEALTSNEVTRRMVNNGDAIPIHVFRKELNDEPEKVMKVISRHHLGKEVDVRGRHEAMTAKKAKLPFAIVVKNSTVLSYAVDEREDVSTDSGDIDKCNQFERTCVMRALHKAAENLRGKGVFESWDLRGAVIVTNIQEIGPMGYGECLWFNVSEIHVLEAMSSPETEILARELPSLSNRELFVKVAADYNVRESPITVSFAGTENTSSTAHLFWKAKVASEKLVHDADLTDLGQSVEDDEGRKQFEITTPGLMKLAKGESSHYNGKETPDTKGLTKKKDSFEDIFCIMKNHE